MLNAQVNSGGDDSPGLLNAVGPKKKQPRSQVDHLPRDFHLTFCTNWLHMMQYTCDNT